ncbi:MAG: PaaI family thioesterase [Rubrimonas sp.]|uniref:PaaI family thioesterase n=1 Tax=Rubrimonas sp. TaxID=2036015 RepID=UPI002FDE4E96
MEPKLTAAELAEFLHEVFPQVRGDFLVEDVGPMRARLRMPVAERHLRPGGTVSGPAMFALADCAYYVATLAMIGREALTVTTSMTVNFLAKPPAADLVCEARVLRLGRVLSVGEATIWSDGRRDGPVAHAAVTYAIPPARETRRAGG